MYSAAMITSLNAKNMEYLKHLSAIKGFKSVRVYLDPRLALAEITENHYELVIIDSDMPDIQALGLATRLLQLKPELWLVIVADSDEYALRALQMGVLDYIVRPVEPDRLENLEEKLNRRWGILWEKQ